MKIFYNILLFLFFSTVVSQNKKATSEPTLARLELNSVNNSKENVENISNETTSRPNFLKPELKLLGEVEREKDEREIVGVPELKINSSDTIIMRAKD